MSETVFIVGEKFGHFSSCFDSVMTVKAFIEQHQQQPKVNAPDLKLHCQLGQGLTQKHFNDLTSTGLVREIPCRASTLFTHKRNKENILITEPHPHPDEEGCYESQVCMSDECAELNDHVTGKHISGLALVEAARQMLNAILEEYHLADQKNIGFVLDFIESRFLHYAFPLRMDLKTRIQITRKHHENMKGFSTTQIIQAGKIIAEIKLGFSTMRNGFLTQEETEQASQAIEYLKGLSANETT